MREKELQVCIWIHHIATFTGLLCGICRLVRNRLCTGRAFALILYIETQAWAVLKIAADVRKGGSRLRKSFEGIRARCENERQERKILAALVASSCLYKCAVPLLLGRRAAPGRSWT